MDENKFREEFIEKLSETYGPWEKNSARFGTISYGGIANELCISGSQFSKLLYGSATDGMYERTFKNIERITLLKQLKKENSYLTKEVNRTKEERIEAAADNSFEYKYFFIIGLLCLLMGYGLKSVLTSEKPVKTVDDRNNVHPLEPFYERDFNSVHISPFLSVADAQEYCPGAAYEGTWELDKEYVIPMPLKKPGLYYVATEIDVKMKCYRNAEPEKRGKVLLGFEKMKHELWIDTKRVPLTPKYFNLESKNYTKEFFNINFEEDPTFKKVATINSFMFNTFEINNEKITRKGEPSGRFAESINHDLVNQYEIDIKQVLKNVVGNMVQTTCQPAQNDHCNPNTLVEGESIMKFDCDFTINNENLGLGGSYPYSKTFKLVKQNYSDNLLCTCED